MSFKMNLAIGTVFLALLAFVYFHEIEGAKERKAEAARAKELLSFQNSAARRLTIDRGDTVVVLENSDGQWRLTRPVEDVADAQAVERYLNNLREAERERVVADSATVAGDNAVQARFGLDAPRLRVQLELDTGALDTLVFGQDTPTDRFVYGQQPGANPEIFVIRAWRFDNLNKGVFDLRDQRVLPFARSAVQAVRLHYPHQTLAVKRVDADNWLVTGPLAARADAEEVGSILSALESAKAVRFVAESADDDQLGQYGLAPVETLELSLLVGDERAEKRLRIGRRTSTGKYYARDMSASQVFEVDSSLVSDVSKTLTELRDHKPLRFDRQQITRIDLERAGGAGIVVEQDTAGVWGVVLPDTLAAKSWKMSSVLTDLADLEADSFVDSSDSAYEQASERFVWVLSGTAGELARIRFLSTGDQDAYAVCPGDPAVYRIAMSDLEKLDLQLDDLAEVPAAEVSAATADTASASAHP